MCICCAFKSILLLYYLRSLRIIFINSQCYVSNIYIYLFLSLAQVYLPDHFENDSWAQTLLVLLCSLAGRKKDKILKTDIKLNCFFFLFRGSLNNKNTFIIIINHLFRRVKVKCTRDTYTTYLCIALIKCAHAFIIQTTSI